MIGINLIMEGDGAFPEIADKGVFHVLEDIKMTCLPGGMASGKPSVAILVPLPDDQYVVIETSLALLLSAADAFRSKYGDPRYEH